MGDRQRPTSRRPRAAVAAGPRARSSGEFVKCAMVVRMGDPPAAFVELGAMARAFQRSQALAVAAELQVGDLLSAGARTVDDLATETGTHAPTLYRLLRALASLGVLFEHEGQQFALTEMGEYLRSDHPMSIQPVVTMFC